MKVIQRIAIICLAGAALVELAGWIILPFRGYDTYSHIFWIDEWHKLWSQGIFYPRWLPDSFKGFGAPSFYFYPPLSFFLTSILYAILPNLSPATVGKILGILIFVVSGLTMWLYLKWRNKNCENPNIALWAALLFIFAPYRFFDYAVRGAISEHLALVFIPLAFWGTDLLAEQRNKRDTRRGLSLLTVSLAFLLLSNLPAATLAAMGLLVYALTRKTAVRSRFLLAFVGSGLLAILLTTFYLLPIVALFNHVQFRRLWLPVSVVFSSPFLAIFSGEGLTINSYSFLSLLGACILLVGFWRTNHLWIRWLLLMIVFVQLPLVSQILFNHVPPFTIVQLAYRFTLLLLIVLAIVWMDEMRESDKMVTAHEWKPASVVVILWSIGAIGLAGLQLANVHVHQHNLLPLGEAPEYAPRWSRPYYDFGKSLSAPFVTDTNWAVWRNNELVILTDRRTPYSDTIQYTAASPDSILLRRSYWPTWNATIDGQSTSISPDSLGRVLIPAAAGHHTVIASLGSEPSARVGAWISGGAVVILCVLWFVA